MDTLNKLAIESKWDEFMFNSKIGYNSFDICIAHKRYDLVLELIDREYSDMKVILNNSLLAKYISCIAILSSNGLISISETIDRLTNITSDSFKIHKLDELCVNYLVYQWIQDKEYKHNIENKDIVWLRSDISHILYPVLDYTWKYNYYYLTVTKDKKSPITHYYHKLYLLEELYNVCLTNEYHMDYLICQLISSTIVTQSEIDLITQMIIVLVTKGDKSLSYTNPIYGDILIPTCSLNLFRKRLDSAIRYQVAIQYVLKYGRMTRDEINDHIYENKRRLNRFIGPYTRLKMLQIMI